MPNSMAASIFSIPFRRHKQRYTINPPDDVHNVIYLGNVLTIMGKGEASVEKPLSVIWKSYNAKNKRREIPMKLMVTRSGLKVETKQLGLTEYWAHRMTYCVAPENYPRLFCWVYKHEGKRMKPELRCHAVLCKKPVEATSIAANLSDSLQAALMEYKREKRCMEKARKNSLTGVFPRRKMLLQTGTLNFRPPVSRSKSAPRLGSIDEEDEVEESPYEDLANIDDTEEISEVGSLCYRELPLGEDALSTSSSSSTDCSDRQLQRQNSMTVQRRRQFSQLAHRFEHVCSTSSSFDTEHSDVVQEEDIENSVADDIPASSTSSYASSDDGFISSSHSDNLQQEELMRCKALSGDRDSLSDESGYHDDVANGERRLAHATSGEASDQSDSDGEKLLPKNQISRVAAFPAAFMETTNSSVSVI